MGSFARLAGFFVVALILARVLGHLPVVGGLFRATGILGVWISAILLSLGLSRWGERALRVQRDRARMRELRAVESPRNHGKLGALLLAQGRPRRAAEALARAVEGEPDVAEWRYRHGRALLRSRRYADAAEAFRRCLELEEEYAYGDARLRLAEAEARLGEHADALATLERFERDHGPRPESAYRRGVSLRASGRRDEARDAFREAVRLAGDAARYQRREAGLWGARARWAAFF